MPLNLQKPIYSSINNCQKLETTKRPWTDEQKEKQQHIVQQNTT